MYLGTVVTKHLSGILTRAAEVNTAYMAEELDLWFQGGLSDMGVSV